MSSKNQYPILTVIAAGLYPFLHYYNSNLHIANSWQQLVFMLMICFGIPMFLLISSSHIFKLKLLQKFKKQRLTIINLVVFSVLIGLLVFSFRKKATVLVIIFSVILAILLYKHIKKIIVFQMLMAVMSLINLVSLLSFALNQDNNDWVNFPKELLETKFINTPNIFVIQPDGYVNRSEINDPPYNYDNSIFYNYLKDQNFSYYENFRSNYLSTLTSNASLFGMRHHYYTNTYHKKLQTLNANEVIVGEHNNVLRILKNNNYQSHLFVDNSYFLINRELMHYDYCNVLSTEVPYIESGGIDTSIVDDLNLTLDTIQSTRNFFFIEKTTPSHISSSKGKSKGKVKERELYFKRLEQTNDWLKILLKRIEVYDKNALVIIVADHGGYVGMDYASEADHRKMNEDETKSAFSSMLAIKWPHEMTPNNLEFKSSVNLFSTLFYALSNEDKFLKVRQKNESYMPLYENGNSVINKVINDNGAVIFEAIKSK